MHLSPPPHLSVASAIVCSNAVVDSLCFVALIVCLVQNLLPFVAYNVLRQCIRVFTVFQSTRFEVSKKQMVKMYVTHF